MNSSKLDSSRRDTDRASTTTMMPTPAEKKKNIREIYLQALHHNKGFKRTTHKKNNITNLSKDELKNPTFSGSAILEKELSLVQRILADTKELKSLNKTKSSEANTPAQVSRQSVPVYKTPEEYGEEILALKKALRYFQSNEVINKTKFEYYDNELAKKEQEILDLLDVKKAEELRLSAESKSDLASIIYGLKQKAYKLEFALKRKDNELTKLKSDMKVTNMKELKKQNERLRSELAKALMNDTKIIEAFDKKGMLEDEGRSFYDTSSHRTYSEISLNKRLEMKQNIARQLRGDDYENNNELLAKLSSKDFEHKIILRGSLEQQFYQLDKRETDCLKEIARLNEEIKKMDEEIKNFKLTGGGKVDRDEKSQLNAVKTLQSILRGHSDRMEFVRQNESRLMSRSPSISLSHRSLRNESPVGRRTPSPPLIDRRRRRHEDRYLEEEEFDPYVPPRRSPPRRRRSIERTPSPYQRPRSPPRRRKNQFSDDEGSVRSVRSDSKKLIEQKPVDQTDGGGYCSPWRLFPKDNKKT